MPGIMVCCSLLIIFRAKWKESSAFLLFSVQRLIWGVYNLNSKMIPILKRSTIQPFTKRRIYPLMCEPNPQVNENGAVMYKMAWSVDFYFTPSLLSPTHLDSVHVLNVPSQTLWKDEAWEGRVADWNLPWNFKRGCVQETIYLPFWSLTSKTRITAGIFYLQLWRCLQGSL